MHEIGISQRILDIALQYAEEAGGGPVTDLYLVIGELSTYIDDSVQLYWDILSRETQCAGARLHFQRIRARLQCQDCGCVYGLPDGRLLTCPDCGASRIHILQGQEFRLDSIDILEKEWR